MTFHKTIQQALQKTLSLLLPNHCLLCDDPCSDALCEQCQRDLPTLVLSCEICSVPLTATGICGECQQHKPSYDASVIPFLYAGHLPTLINQFKHRGQRRVGTLLTSMLENSLAKTSDKPDLLVPVPLHWRHLALRGFNQSEIIAQQLSKQTAIPLAHPLKKRRATRHQQQLTRKQRLANNRHAFYLKQACSVRHVGLVDDVVTTGATAEILAQMLKRNGVDKITVCALARTPKQQ
ncbi:ComF family protein [Teredinibacter purpureus]|uniref:ComF family protein n=1 Tax=Teredinibacter purpureus TaxID=2731756 RepID=UPI000695B069|nr:ComF family protein [Teredinibacter purpureus]